MSTALDQPTLEQIWRWLEDVSDPEIPVLSVVELGIVRELRWENEEELTVTITPTYSGCPAMRTIEEEITNLLRARGIRTIRLVTQLSPAWTTDWLTEKAREKLKAYGIAPPKPHATSVAVLHRTPVEEGVYCPRCGSHNCKLISQFSTTACQALYRCTDCLEPFNYFKQH